MGASRGVAWLIGAVWVLVCAVLYNESDNVVFAALGALGIAGYFAFVIMGWAKAIRRKDR